MFRHELTFAVITSILASMLIYSATLTFDLSAVMKRISNIQCDDLSPSQDADHSKACCWTQRDDGTGEEEAVCCYERRDNGDMECEHYQTVPPRMTLPGGDLPQLETVPPNRTLPGGGVNDLPTLEQVPPRTLPGGGDLPTLQPGPGLNQGTEGEPPLPVVCSEEAGLVKDPETGQCVPIEQPPPSPPRVEDAQQPEEPEEQPDEDDDEQSSDGGDSSEGNNNGNNEDDD